MKSIAIEVKDVTKTYVLRHEKPTLIENVFSRLKVETHIALDNISFSIQKGDRIGIMGKNGSGKTTLLKLLAGITSQQSGKIKVYGRVVSLIDLAAGFHPELTGEENIYLNGLIIGMSRKELKEKKDSIVEFADLGKFVDAPLYTYSSGMQMRLGFSVAVHSEPDVLLLDEGFVVGDGVFRDKARLKMKEFQKKKVTTVMVGHWLSELEKNCNKFLWLDQGVIIKLGGKKILKEYEFFCRES